MKCEMYKPYRGRYGDLDDCLLMCVPNGVIYYPLRCELNSEAENEFEVWITNEYPEDEIWPCEGDNFRRVSALEFVIMTGWSPEAAIENGLNGGFFQI